MKTKKILFILIMMASAVLSHAELINIQIDGLTYHCNTITKKQSWEKPSNVTILKQPSFLMQ